MEQLEFLTEVQDLRKVWPHEALDFTPWLAKDENIAILANEIGMEIAVDGTESAVGDFSVDIIATDIATGQKVIIENQLEDTNHDHLGKLITYAAGKDAQTIIWVVKHAREEHRAAIEWLNNHTDDDIGFFLCEIHLYKVGGSNPAVKFSVIEKPNDWIKSVKKNQQQTESQQFRLDYWTAFNEYAYANAQFARQFGKRKASNKMWMNLSIGSSVYDICLRAVKTENLLVVELYIRGDKDLYHQLFEKQNAIEQELGVTLDWRELPEKKASRIMLTRQVNFDDRSAWNAQFDWMMEMALKFKKYSRSTYNMKMPPEAMPPGAFFNFPALSACPFSLLHFPQFFHRKLRMAVRAGKIRIAEVNCANHPAVFRGKIVVLRFFGTGVHQMMRRFHCECCLAMRAEMLLHEHKDRMRDGVLDIFHQDSLLPP